MPAAVRWYRAYCVLLAALNFALVAIGVLVVYQNKGFETQTQIVAALTGAVFVPVGLFFGFTTLFLPRLPATKKSWSVHMANIAFGAASLVLAPVCIPLLAAWFKPEVKAYFGIVEGS
ncbi:MAG: hypothetical protein KIT11_02005 [Fimbriimonadaceae bacterium]|nr:hypothetical protein [Fimbriimonadaceae bacterium]QYK54855.1 MAG: hypothetical protein KF733_07530 [Fimbriimonadaceae bacterium]